MTAMHNSVPVNPYAPRTEMKNPTSRSSDPGTSHAASAKLQRRAMVVKLLALFAAAGSGGLTAEEAEIAMDAGPRDGVWKRVSDMNNAGLITPLVVDGKQVTRVSTSNRQQRVLVITDAGLAAE